MRFMLARILNPAADEIDFNTIGTYLPDVYRNDSSVEATAASAGPGFRIIKTHGGFQEAIPKAIVITRDGRDVITSFYHYQRQSGKPRSVSSLIREGVWRFGTWQANVASWLDAIDQEPDRILLLRYEDMLSDPLSAVTRVTAYLGLEVSASTVHRAVEKADRKNMAKAEVLGKPDHLKEVKFVREARKGSHSELFTHRDERVFLRYCGAVMQRAGYSINPAGSA